MIEEQRAYCYLREPCQLFCEIENRRVKWFHQNETAITKEDAGIFLVSDKYLTIFNYHPDLGTEFWCRSKKKEQLLMVNVLSPFDAVCKWKKEGGLKDVFPVEMTMESKHVCRCVGEGVFELQMKPIGRKDVEWKQFIPREGIAVDVDKDKKEAGIAVKNHSDFPEHLFRCISVDGNLNYISETRKIGLKSQEVKAMASQTELKEYHWNRFENVLSACTFLVMAITCYWFIFIVLVKYLSWKNKTRVNSLPTSVVVKRIVVTRSNDRICPDIRVIPETIEV